MKKDIFALLKVSLSVDEKETLFQKENIDINEDYRKQRYEEYQFRMKNNKLYTAQIRK